MCESGVWARCKREVDAVDGLTGQAFHRLAVTRARRGCSKLAYMSPIGIMVLSGERVRVRSEAIE